MHPNRPWVLLSEQMKHFLNAKGIGTSKTTAGNSQSDEQVERLNGTIRRYIPLATKTRFLPTTETVLQDALHSIRSLLCMNI